MSFYGFGPWFHASSGSRKEPVGRSEYPASLPVGLPSCLALPSVVGVRCLNEMHAAVRQAATERVPSHRYSKSNSVL